jgi:hypothetical protein
MRHSTSWAAPFETFANRTLAEELTGMYSQRVSQGAALVVPPTFSLTLKCKAGSGV